MRERKPFCPLLYPDWAPIIKTLSEHERSELMLGMVLYPSYEPDFPLWAFFKDQLEKQASKFTEKCKKNSETARAREEEKRNSKPQACTNVHERDEACTNEHECSRKSTNDHLEPIPIPIPIPNKSSSSRDINVAREEINAELSALSSKTSDPEPVQPMTTAAHAFNDKNKNSWIAFCKQERPDVDANELFEKFSTKYAAMNGSGPRLTDAEWFGKWKYWVNHEIVSQSSKNQSVKAPPFGSIGLGKSEVVAGNICFKLREHPEDIPKALRKEKMTWSDLEQSIDDAIIGDREVYESVIAPLIVKYGIS